LNYIRLNNYKYLFADHLNKKVGQFLLALASHCEKAKIIFCRKTWTPAAKYPKIGS